MKPPNELDMASLKYDMRKLYKEVGFAGMLQVLSEILLSAQICSEVIVEEKKKGDKDVPPSH